MCQSSLKEVKNANLYGTDLNESTSNYSGEFDYYSDQVTM